MHVLRFLGTLVATRHAACFLMIQVALTFAGCHACSNDLVRLLLQEAEASEGSCEPLQGTSAFDKCERVASVMTVTDLHLCTACLQSPHHPQAVPTAVGPALDLKRQRCAGAAGYLGRAGPAAHPPAACLVCAGHLQPFCKSSISSCKTWNVTHVKFCRCATANRFCSKTCSASACRPAALYAAIRWGGP